MISPRTAVPSTALVLLLGCSAAAPDEDMAEAARTEPGAALPTALSGSTWQLVEFQSMDDAIGKRAPADPAVYTMQLGADGTVAMQLDCNRATGTWSATESTDGTSGTFELGPLAVTQALCPEPSMGERIAADAAHIRSYLLRDGRLYLSLMADAGIYSWEPEPAAGTGSGNSATAGVPAVPENGGPRAFVVTAGPELALREQPTETAAAIGSNVPGALLNNLGCQGSPDEFWCDVQELSGGPRGYVPGRRIEPAISPDGTVARGLDDSAQRAGEGEFDATGNLPCAQASGQPMGQCAFGVARAGGGYATVVVTRPDGIDRIIFFQMGLPMGFNYSQAEGDMGEFEVDKDGDLNHVRIGDERYEIPDAVILGG